MVTHLSSLQQALDFISRNVGDHIRLATPLGLGKPNGLLNAIYEDVKKDTNKQLKVFTALSLGPPEVEGDLARRFFDPFVERQWGTHYPKLKYYMDAVKGKTPENIEIHEFYFQAGTALKSKHLQQHYQSVNYTHVAEDILTGNLNLAVQLIAKSKKGDSYSLSCNPDVTLDMMELYKNSNKKMWLIGVVHPDLPFLKGDCEVQEDFFDAIVESDDCDHNLFALPRLQVSLVDHYIGFYASQLMPDNGTIQIGIGSLSDAVVSALRVRHLDNAKYQKICEILRVENPYLGTFVNGIYGLTEMLTDGYMHLRQAGILKREVVDDAQKQKTYLHGSFFLGSKEFYRWLKEMSPSDASGLRMTRVSKVNDLFDPKETLLRQQRIHARFYNTTMQVSLLGEAMSETLGDASVVSGVGGQYNFVAMSRELKGARSILMLRSTRLDHSGRRKSNIVWEPGHVTIPRHLRDIVVTEYGVADLRGKSDCECIQSMIQIADSQFQNQLIRVAQHSGKLKKNYVLPQQYRQNSPRKILSTAYTSEFKDVCKPFPFGSDFTEEEEKLFLALAQLQEDRKVSILKIFRKAFFPKRTFLENDFLRELERLKLASPKTMKEWFYKKLIHGYLKETHL